MLWATPRRPSCLLSPWQVWKTRPSMSETTRTSLIDLPEELLACIVDYHASTCFSLSELSGLRQSCKTLHHLTTPHLYRSVTIAQSNRIGWGDLSPSGLCSAGAVLQHTKEICIDWTCNQGIHQTRTQLSALNSINIDHLRTKVERIYIMPE